MWMIFTLCFFLSGPRREKVQVVRRYKLCMKASPVYGRGGGGLWINTKTSHEITKSLLSVNWNKVFFIILTVPALKTHTGTVRYKMPLGLSSHGEYRYMYGWLLFCREGVYVFSMDRKLKRTKHKPIPIVTNGCGSGSALDPHWFWSAGSGSRRAKMTHKNRNEELSCFKVLNVLFRHQNLGYESGTGSGSALT